MDHRLPLSPCVATHLLIKIVVSVLSLCGANKTASAEMTEDLRTCCKFSAEDCTVQLIGG